MTTAEKIQAFFADAHELECVENTYRPDLNGTRRTITKLRKSGYDCGPGFRGEIPLRAADIIALTDDTLAYKLQGPKGPKRLAGHTVTLRKVATR